MEMEPDFIPLFAGEWHAIKGLQPFNFNEEDKEASIYTYNKGLIKKLDKYCADFPKLYKLTRKILR